MNNVAVTNILPVIQTFNFLQVAKFVRDEDETVTI
jgi:hypothetical protein